MSYTTSAFKRYLSRSSFFKDSFWAILGSGFGRGLILAASVCIAKLLGSEQYGVYSFCKILLINIALFANWGLGYTATCMLAKKGVEPQMKKIIRKLYSSTVFFALLAIVLAALLYPWWSTYISLDYSGWIMLFLGILIIFNSIANTQNGIIAGLKAYRPQAKLSLINGLISFPLTLLLTCWKGLDGALLALLFSQMLLCFQNYRLISNFLHSNDDQRESGESVSDRDKMLRMSFPIAMQEMVYSFSKWILPIIVIQYAGFAQLGVYNASEQFASLILFIPAMLRGVMLSHLSTRADESPGQMAKQMKIMIRVNLLATGVPACLLSLLSTWIAAFYGETYQTMPWVLSVLGFTAVFSAMTNVFSQYLMSVNRSWQLFFYQLFREVTIILCLLLLFVCYPQWNASLSLALSSFGANVLLFVFMWLNHKSAVTA